MKVAVIGEVLGRRLAFYELTRDEFRRETDASWPPPAVEMLLAAWGAAVGHPAYVTTAVADLTGTRPCRSSFQLRPTGPSATDPVRMRALGASAHPESEFPQASHPRSVRRALGPFGVSTVRPTA